MKTMLITREEKEPGSGIKSSADFDNLLTPVSQSCTSVSKAKTTPFRSLSPAFGRIWNDKPAPKKKNNRVKKLVARARANFKFTNSDFLFVGDDFGFDF